MDKFIEGLAAVVKPPWNYVLGIAALVIMGLPRVIEVRDTWLSSRSDMRELEYEKLRLEVLLLQRQLKESASREYIPDVVPEIAREFGTIRIEPRPPVIDEVAPAPAPSQPLTGMRKFVAGHPVPGRALMWIAQIVLAPLIAMFGFATPAILAVGWTDPELGPGMSILLAAVYGVFAWLAYWGFRSAGSIRKVAAA